MRVRLEDKLPFWELLSVIGQRFNFDGEADLQIVEEAPNDSEDDDDDAEPDSTDEDAEVEHKCLVCGRYFKSDFPINKARMCFKYSDSG